MTNYSLETKEFGLSDKGIHLLRSRFNYQTINYDDIDELVIEKGKELNNWALLLAVGLCLLLFSIWYSLKLFKVFYNNEASVIYIEEIVVPVIPFLLGFYFIYSSTKKGTIMKAKAKNLWHKKLSLTDLDKNNSLNKLTNMLNDKIPG